jgi:membrane-bound lytic murein transglycosylase F
MVPDKQERLHFVLASYNAGVGHIYDAIALAKKYHKNEARWYGNVEEFVLLKSHEQYYSDPVCRNGYFRGEETCNFVRDILARFEIYKQKIPK